MRRAVLADTGPLYAAVDTDNQYHARAHEELGRLGREELLVVVLFPILLESYSLVLHRLGIGTAHRWLAEVADGVTLVNPTQEDYLAAMAQIRSYEDQPLTMFDGLLAACGKRLEAPIWTYDHHFDLMRARVWNIAAYD
jgi:predicted nucleic acid-binding protein